MASGSPFKRQASIGIRSAGVLRQVAVRRAALRSPAGPRISLRGLPDQQAA
jgi:hypothetical protein